jgi:hypothetical protein
MLIYETIRPLPDEAGAAQRRLARRLRDGRATRCHLHPSCLVIGPDIPPGSGAGQLQGFDGPWPARVWERFQPRANTSVVASSAEEARELATYLAKRGLYFSD